MKTCSVCNNNKELIEFHKKSMGYLGHDSVCKICSKELSKQKYFANAESIKAKTNAYKAANKETIRQKSKAYDQFNFDAIKKRKTAYREKNKEAIAAQRRQYVQDHKDEINAYQRNKRLTDINFKLKCLLRTRLSNILKFNIKTGSAVEDLGCSVEELKIHLESKFQPGMTWENQGKWEIDHIQALANFNLENREEFLLACHYTNLQPLWASDNRKKSDK